MTEIKISSEDEKEEQPKATTEDVKETLKAADEYEKLKAENDKLEAEYNRRLEIKSKFLHGGKAEAGAEEKTAEQEAEEEAKKILKTFQSE